MSQKTIFANHFLRLEQVTDENGHNRNVVITSDSVALLIYIPAWEKVALVQQSRPAVATRENPAGIIEEALAGRLEGDASVRETMAREAYEETGITVEACDIELLNGGEPLAMSPGLLTEKIYLGFAQVAPYSVTLGTTAYGVSEESEATHRLLIPVLRLKEMFTRGEIHDIKTWALVQWFLIREARKKAV